MPRGVYDRSKLQKKTASTPVEKTKKIYRTKTSARQVDPSDAERKATPAAWSMTGFQNLIAYYHALVVSKTQGVKSAVLDGEIEDTVVQLKFVREVIFGRTYKDQPKTITPPAVTAGAVIQEASPEVPQQAVFTPPA